MDKNNSSSICLEKAVEKKAKEEKTKGILFLNIKIIESANCLCENSENSIISLLINIVRKLNVLLIAVVNHLLLFTVDRVLKEIQLSTKKGNLFIMQFHSLSV